MSAQVTTHRRRLQEIGLDDDRVQQASDGTSSARDDVLLLQEVQEQSDALQNDIESVVEQTLALQSQVEDCLAARQFLQSALDAADDADLFECAAQTNMAIAKQKTVLQRAQRCAGALRELRQEVSAQIDPQRLRRIDQTLAQFTATPTPRESLRTDIELNDD